MSNTQFCIVIVSQYIFLQNDLEEFFAMVNFTNPGILGDVAYFRRYYEVIDYFTLIYYL